MTETTTAPVAIVGAGPVGLSAAIALARSGVRSTVIERTTGAPQHPKARGARVRTMELFRQWGLEEQLRAHALPPQALRFIYCDTLSGRELARTPELEPRTFDGSPTSSCRVAQDSVHQTLFDRAHSEPLIDLRLGVPVAEVTQDPDGVHIRTGDGGQLRARYLIAADGAGSSVRRALGIRTQGQPVVSWWQSVYWTGDLDRYAADRPCIQFVTGADTGRHVQIASVDGRRRWITLIALPPGPDRPADLTEEQALAAIRGAVGDAGLEVTVKDIATFRVSAQNADRYRAGRIFLAGDAAHILPPTGGMGMNSGIQDAHNLAWKLAFVLSGHAGPGLLDSYESERRPVAEENLAWSLDNGRRFPAIRQALADGDTARTRELLDAQGGHVSALGQDLGFAYSKGVLLPDGTEPPAHRPEHYEPTARPGHRAPHVPLPGGKSTLDLYDRDFTLITGSADPGWADAGRPGWLQVLRIGDTPLHGAPADLHQAHGIGTTGAVLVRPDGHVAWRAATAPDKPAETLRSVLHILGLHTADSPARKTR
jgi:2-polyprenyl-6-methoxyphenol hydroxylase-like FAD-dependent oxidoreductase